LATIYRFEDLEAWQRARVLVKAVYAISGEGRFATDFALRDQMRRAVISIPSNIAEGFERNGRAEFVQFLSIAKGSSGELKAQIYLAEDLGYLSDEATADLVAQTTEVSNLIGGLMKYLRTSNFKGSKFKTSEQSTDRPATPTRNSKP